MPGDGSSLSWPEQQLDLELWEDQLRPRYLTVRDELWVEELADRLLACEGRSAAEVEERLARLPQLGERPRAYRALAKLLLKLHGFEVQACRPPPQLREALFVAAGGDRPPLQERGEVLVCAAAALGISAAALERDLYADLPQERRLRPLESQLSPPALIERYNLALAQAILRRAERVELRAEGAIKTALRFARLQRLLCWAELTPRGPCIQLAGPLSLFRHTTKYGHQLASWLPAVVRTIRWELEAVCLIGGEERRWQASYRDPIGTTHARPRRFDSRLEAHFFRQLRRVASCWEVLREADPVQVGRSIVCPDFTLVDRQRGLRVPVEIIGYWTPQYLARKRAIVSRLPAHSPWLLCVDEQLAAAASWKLPPDVFSFRRRIAIEPFLRFLDRWLARRLRGDG